MTNDLISRSELKKAFNKWWGCDDIPSSVVEDLIDEAPTFEQKEFEQILQPIKVNIPEDIKDKLVEELSKPRKVIPDEPETVTDCIIAYGDGFESARRLFERPHGEWINTRPPEMSDNIICSLCGYDSIASFNYCPNCGADMRKGEEE